MKFSSFLIVSFLFFGTPLALPATPAAVQVVVPSFYVKKAQWGQTMVDSREALLRSGTGSAQEILDGMEDDFPMQWDWLLQDAKDEAIHWFNTSETADITSIMLHRVIQDLGDEGRSFQTEQNALTKRDLPPGGPQWLELYEKACQRRRELRLKPLILKSQPIVFTKHYNMGGSHYAYTEGQSDAQSERHFIPGSSLCLLEMDGATARVRALLKDDFGVIRDPAVSYDGKRILFAWKKSDRKDDYHLYEMEVENGKTRQLTFGLGFADYEGTYLPNGDILFNSTRCVQTVDCWWTEVSNLYACNKDGRFLRRITFDQVHDNYPTVLDDGRVIYTRWEYNDRGQVFPQPLFQMNSDGTGQTEFYGNNSWFPTSILHARGIQGTQKVLAILSGHHCLQAGKLAVIDPSKGRQEADGVQLIAPVRKTVAERIDPYGQQGELFQYPYPLSEENFLVSYDPLGWRDDNVRKERSMKPRFKLYFMRSDGCRELLVADPQTSCNQAVPLASRQVPLDRASMVDYRQSSGTYLMQDIYAGKALAGVEKGTITRLRVVAIDYRAAGVGANGSSGKAGGALSSTPPSITNGCWDPKIILGEATVYEDGSAFFKVPARMPIYFQALDKNGRVVQTMRSWSTLQPGENASCIGCHEDKNTPALSSRRALKATLAGAEPLKPFYGPARPFSFSTEIQPILNRNCVSCHNERSPVVFPWVKPDPHAPAGSAPSATPAPVPGKFSLLGEPNLDVASQRQWSDSYVYLTNCGKPNAMVNWIEAQSIPSMLPPNFAGSAKSSLLEMLEKGHHNVKLSKEEFDKIACWIDLAVPYCGDYREAAAWSPADVAKYDSFLRKRRRMQEVERTEIEAMLAARYGPQASISLKIINVAGNCAGPDQSLQQGDRIEIKGPTHMMIRLSPNLPESLVYSPEGRVEFPVPLGSGEVNAYPDQAFSGKESAISVRPATATEISTYRNVALNPYDVRGVSTFFPHATSNSECRNESGFAARNAIDGSLENRGHGGWPHQSWGPDQRTDLWWKVDFGRSAEIDKVVLTVRADFPHDKVWSSATLRFSDGSTQKIGLRAVKVPQAFTFEKRTVSWVELTDLVQEKPLSGWCALTEFEVFGREADNPGNAPVAAAR